MTVFRRGLHTPTQPAPIHVSLGHLVVTIDDLRALLQLLTPDEQAKVKSSQIRVDFGGGYFDSPQDLRELSDVELEILKIHTSDIEVQLGREIAVVIGLADACNVVSNKWARQRQTMELPSTVGRRFMRKWKWMTIVLSLLALAVILISIPALDMITRNPNLVSPLLTAAAFVAFVADLIFVSRTRWPPSSYAVIDPVTLEERRKAQISRSRHLQAAIIALAGVVVALIAVIVTIVVS